MAETGESRTQRSPLHTLRPRNPSGHARSRCHAPIPRRTLRQLHGRSRRRCKPQTLRRPRQPNHVQPRGRQPCCSRCPISNLPRISRQLDASRPVHASALQTPAFPELSGPRVTLPPVIRRRFVPLPAGRLVSPTPAEAGRLPARLPITSGRSFQPATAAEQRQCSFSVQIISVASEHCCSAVAATAEERSSGRR